jgi:hypothetical protein
MPIIFLFALLIKIILMNLKGLNYIIYILKDYLMAVISIAGMVLKIQGLFTQA